MSNNEQTNQFSVADVAAILSTRGTHKSLGEIEIFGVRVKSNYSNNLMYMTIIDGDIIWVYDYETEIFENNKVLPNQDYDRELIIDYGVKIQEYLLKPPFNLEHSQHGIACEKLNEIRNSFLENRKQSN